MSFLLVTSSSVMRRGGILNHLRRRLPAQPLQQQEQQQQRHQKICGVQSLHTLSSSSTRGGISHQRIALTKNPSILWSFPRTHNNPTTTRQIVQQTTRRTVWLFGSSSSAESSTKAKWSQFWKRTAWFVRTLRIPVLVFSVYKIGYQQGIIECTKHPEALQQQILQAMVSNNDSGSGQVEIVSERDISYLNPHPHHQVAVVGHRIVSAARELVQENLETAIRNKLTALPEDSTPKQILEHLKRDDEFHIWYDAALRLMGEVNTEHLAIALHQHHATTLQQEQHYNQQSQQQPPPKQPPKQTTASTVKANVLTKLKHLPWQYVFVQSDNPNAFVSEVLPRKIFITTGMLELASSPDELALVLGHEISHLILGHVTESGYIELFLRTIEVTLLSLDPTAGLLSLAFVGGLAWIRKALSAAYSREHETEADDLGIVITARACYDTQRGAQVMYKMNQAGVALAPRVVALEVNNNNESTTNDRTPNIERGATLLDTHPPTLERYERLLKQAKDGENYTKYRHDQCASMSTRIAAVLGWPMAAPTKTTNTKQTPTPKKASKQAIEPTNA